MNPLQLLLLCLAGWLNRNQSHVIDYLHDEIRVLKERQGKKPLFNDDQRRWLAAKASKIEPKWLNRLTTPVSQRALLECRRRLIAQKYDGTSKRAPGRLSTRQELRELVLRMDREIRTWSYTRLQRALRNLGHEISGGAIDRVLTEAGMDPAPERKQGTTWKEFLRTHWEVLAAADLITLEEWAALGLVRYHMRFVMRLTTREVHIAEVIAEPNGAWMKQITRNLTNDLLARLARLQKTSRDQLGRA
jgi:putative transposase